MTPDSLDAERTLGSKGIVASVAATLQKKSVNDIIGRTKKAALPGNPRRAAFHNSFKWQV